MEIVYRNISELKPAEYNSNRMTKAQFEELKISLQSLEAIVPAVINTHPGRENIIIGGHQRIRAAMAIGFTEYPCVQVDFDEKKEREANLRLNRTGKLDIKLLNQNFSLPELKGLGLDNLQLMGKNEKTVTFTTKPKKVKCPSCEEIFDAKDHRVEE